MPLTFLVTVEFKSFHPKMNRYDKALYDVVDSMLAARKCVVEDQQIRHQLVELLRNKLCEIAVQTTNGANHAGRTSASYFDLERAFRLMGIEAGDLKSVKEGYPPVKAVRCPAPRTQQQKICRGPKRMLTATPKKEMAKLSYVPDYLPPFPPAHTYKGTLMEKRPNKTYVTARICQSGNQQGLKKALNGFFLNAYPSTPIFPKFEGDTKFNLLEIGTSQTPPYLRALKPRDQIFETDIYEVKEEITHESLNCPFLMEPKLKSSRQSGQLGCGEDVEMLQPLKNVELESDSEDEVEVERTEAKDGQDETGTEPKDGLAEDSVEEINWLQPD
ncbi:transcription initiation factor TFIID subunit 8 [Drosophila bipectinata]|uniref:transcription initiation factor TFIID subunit 8 n=1 Tax=Drosophila bipectinata TaxID=42026 RepID=UPI0038B251B8